MAHTCRTLRVLKCGFPPPEVLLPHPHCHLAGPLNKDGSAKNPPPLTILSKIMSPLCPRSLSSPLPFYFLHSTYYLKLPHLANIYTHGHLFSTLEYHVPEAATDSLLLPYVPETGTTTGFFCFNLYLAPISKY